MRVLWFFLGLFVSLGAAVAKPPAAEVRTYLNYDALQPGQQAALAVVVTVPTGLHAQSHTPSSEDFIALTLTPAEVSPMMTLPPQYPKGEEVNYPQLGKLNVYTGTVTVYLPFSIPADAQPGSLPLSGTVRLQMCDEQSCYPPATLPFSATLPIVGKEQAVKPANAEHFAGFDARVFATAVSPTGPPASASPAPAAATEIQLFGWRFALDRGQYAFAFTLAFLVGLIFNLMPCVLPVVPLKAIGFYEASRHNRLKCLMLGIVFSIGLLTVFAILAGFVIVGKAAWGELFAKGWFVWSMAGILVIVAAFQLGVGSLILPNAVYNHVPDHSSWLGNYLFGGFTAILSTPCTAPMFLGLLLWATRQPTWIGIAAVMNVGFGMAFPYLVLAAIPELARRVPRTGAWSELLKQFMAFLLLAVAAYFVAGRLIAGNGYLWVVFGVVAAGCIFLVWRTATLSPTPRAITIASAIALLLTGGMLSFTLNLTRSQHDAIPWQPYSQEAFDQAVREKRPVLLEFTANWCANCKELESRVFNDLRTAHAISAANILPMRADLTLDSAPGWAKLRSLSEAGGIPLTVIYSPKLDNPLELSSIYSTDNLLAAIAATK